MSYLHLYQVEYYYCRSIHNNMCHSLHIIIGKASMADLVAMTIIIKLVFIVTDYIICMASMGWLELDWLQCDVWQTIS